MAVVEVNARLVLQRHFVGVAVARLQRPLSDTRHAVVPVVIHLVDSMPVHCSLSKQVVADSHFQRIAFVCLNHRARTLTVDSQNVPGVAVLNLSADPGAFDD
jgi:hypothetical protein